MALRILDRETFRNFSGNREGGEAPFGTYIIAGLPLQLAFPPRKTTNLTPVVDLTVPARRFALKVCFAC